MITHTKWYEGDLGGWKFCRRDVVEMEEEGWAVRQILQSNGSLWVVVYERNEN